MKAAAATPGIVAKESAAAAMEGGLGGGEYIRPSPMFRRIPTEIISSERYVKRPDGQGGLIPSKEEVVTRNRTSFSRTTKSV
jgi:hypothetical protein